MYSTGCPKCNVLKRKLSDAGIEHTVVEDVDTMLAIGLKEVPYLEVDGVLMNFYDACNWINERV